MTHRFILLMLHFGDDSHTGIAHLLSPQGENDHSPMVKTDETPWCDLNGRRVHRASKGVYIRNGRKMIVK